MLYSDMEAIARMLQNAISERINEMDSILENKNAVSNGFKDQYKRLNTLEISLHDFIYNKDNGKLAV